MTIPLSVARRVEDAGLNASAPPQQRWLDGWLIRFSPGKAKRARCVNAVAPGSLPIAQKLALCQAVFDDARLPLIVRVTPMSHPDKLDSLLERHGMRAFDDTRVMVRLDITSLALPVLPDGLTMHRVGHAAFAQVVGQLRGSPIAQQQAHAQRLELAPVPFDGWVIRRAEDGVAVACGQTATEGDLVGLYDVFTAPTERNRGLARILCERLLAGAAKRSGCRTAYLQVDGNNLPARAVYHRLGFVHAYAYHYRSAAEQVD